MRTDVGPRFVTALVARDTSSMLRLFSPDLQLRGMTPGRFWTADSAEDAVHAVLYRWFEPSDVVQAVEHLESATVVDRERVDYRMRVCNADGLFAVEQRAYLDVDREGHITRMHVICSGFRALPVPAPPAAVHPAVAVASA